MIKKKVLLRGSMDEYVGPKPSLADAPTRPDTPSAIAAQEPTTVTAYVLQRVRGGWTFQTLEMPPHLINAYTSGRVEGPDVLEMILNKVVRAIEKRVYNSGR